METFSRKGNEMDRNEIFSAFDACLETGKISRGDLSPEEITEMLREASESDCTISRLAEIHVRLYRATSHCSSVTSNSVRCYEGGVRAVVGELFVGAVCEDRNMLLALKPVFMLLCGPKIPVDYEETSLAWGTVTGVLSNWTFSFSEKITSCTWFFDVTKTNWSTLAVRWACKTGKTDSITVARYWKYWMKSSSWLAETIFAGVGEGEGLKNKIDFRILLCKLIPV